MGVKKYIRKILNKVLIHYGYEAIPIDILYDWQKQNYFQGGRKNNYESNVPEGARSHLRVNNPKLIELQKRYSVLDKAVTAPGLWKNDYLRAEDILYFRGDNAYVFQLRGENMNIMGYALTLFYLKSIDKLDLLSKLKEDDFFGIFTFTIDDKLVSRDLLDSIIEIYFIENHLNISSSCGNFNILDIGAGYGRLAHRFINAIPNVHYYCTDAIALSTFISDYYLRFRKLEGRAKVVPLNEIEDLLKKQPIDIALNIHSFSECRISAVEWWASLLSKSRVRYLMIVPNSLDHGGTLLLTNDREDIKGIVEKHGYKLIFKDPKYRDPVLQKYAINPTYHYLFELC